MKIAVLSLYLHSNYGGILQSWALQETLRSLGHSPVILRYEGCPPPLVLFPFIVIHRFYLRRIRKQDIHLLERIYTQNLERNIKAFVTTEINRSPILKDENSISEYCRKNNFDAIIVGSDQVWRPEWTSPVFFLSFLNKNHSVIRIGYAVSFGCDSPDFGSLAKSYADLASRFDSLSVRESDGVEQCRKLLGVEAEPVLDPTMLIEPERYLRRFGRSNPDRPSNYLATYFLCETQKFRQIADGMASMSNLEILALPSADEYKESLIPKPLKSVETWISSIEKSAFVMTDSFHGCVFSILFGKSFVAFDNGTGVGRIRSLLDFLGLSYRIVSSEESLSEIWKILVEPLPIETIHEKINSARTKSLRFLKRALRQGFE